MYVSLSCGDVISATKILVIFGGAEVVVILSMNLLMPTVGLRGWY